MTASRKGSAAPAVRDAFSDAEGRPLAFKRRAAPVRAHAAMIDAAIESALGEDKDERPWASAVILAAPNAGAFTAEDEARCLKQLPRAMQLRLAAFSNDERRSQSIRARLLALILAARVLELRPELRLREETPFGPVLYDPADGKTVVWLTLAHCPGASAASASIAPMGLDIEQPRPVSRLAAIASYAYGESAGGAFARWAQTVSPNEAEEAFFALWGAKEGEAKMNRSNDAASPRRVRAIIAPAGDAGWRLEALDPFKRPVPLFFIRAAESFVTALGPDASLAAGSPAPMELEPDWSTPKALLDALEDIFPESGRL